MGAEHAHHWPFVWAAYAVTAIGLSGLVAAVTLNLRRWARRAKDLENGDVG